MGSKDQGQIDETIEIIIKTITQRLHDEESPSIKTNPQQARGFMEYTEALIKPLIYLKTYQAMHSLDRTILVPKNTKLIA